jgi:hypothetical protein
MSQLSGNFRDLKPYDRQLDFRRTQFDLLFLRQTHLLSAVERNLKNIIIDRRQEFNSRYAVPCPWIHAPIERIPTRRHSILETDPCEASMLNASHDCDAARPTQKIYYFVTGCTTVGKLAHRIPEDGYWNSMLQV